MMMLSQGEGGGGQRVMIGIIIEVNDYDCGRPLKIIDMMIFGFLFKEYTNFQCTGMQCKLTFFCILPDVLPYILWHARLTLP